MGNSGAFFTQVPRKKSSARVPRLLYLKGDTDPDIEIQCQAPRKHHLLPFDSALVLDAQCSGVILPFECPTMATYPPSRLLNPMPVVGVSLQSTRELTSVTVASQSSAEDGSVIDWIMTIGDHIALPRYPLFCTQDINSLRDVVHNPVDDGRSERLFLDLIKYHVLVISSEFCSLYHTPYIFNSVRVPCVVASINYATSLILMISHSIPSHAKNAEIRDALGFAIKSYKMSYVNYSPNPNHITKRSLFFPRIS